MGIGEVYWVTYFIVYIIFGLFWNWSGRATDPTYGWVGGWLPNAILFFLLGWKLFGFIIHA